MINLPLLEAVMAMEEEEEEEMQEKARAVILKEAKEVVGDPVEMLLSTPRVVVIPPNVRILGKEEQMLIIMMKCRAMHRLQSWVEMDQ